MNKTPLVLALTVTVALAALVAAAAQELQQRDQAVLARWADVHAAEQAQFADVPAVLAWANAGHAAHAVDAHARCSRLAQFEGGGPLIDDAQRFDRYKQTRAECTGMLFQLLAALRSDPQTATHPHVQALGRALTQGQAVVDSARERYRQALAAHHDELDRLPRGLATALMGEMDRPDFVRHAGARP